MESARAFESSVDGGRSPARLRMAVPVVGLVVSFLVMLSSATAQDASTGAIRGVVEDAAGARVAAATVAITDMNKGYVRRVTASAEGEFSVPLLGPSRYSVVAEAPGMAAGQAQATVEVGGMAEVTIRLGLRAAGETVLVEAEASMVATQTSAVSSVLSEEDISDLPLNGRRFSDLTLLTPGVSQDPRGLTSASNGDLAFGGLRGWQSSYLVDGADNNNAFFAQARGRYRAPYQFSNEVVQEFRVSSNSYGAELGRAGGGVVNVVTRSGNNYLHGTAFYYLRDSKFNAQHPYTEFKAGERQHQFGGTLGGPIRKNKAFFFGGFDQHIFHVPTVVHFLNNQPYVMPQATDYEVSDYSLVMATAQALSAMGGTYRSRLVGNTGFAKVEWSLTPRHMLTARINTSRYYGENNVFFDPASPVTTYAITENGEEDVATESAVVSLESAFSSRLTSNLRAQFSRDLQESTANASFPLTKIYGVTDGYGRSSILPRRTREHRLHVAETLSLSGRRHTWKLGGDMIATWIYNWFPSLYGGEYIFDDIGVNPWTFAPQTYGMRISPLRAYAHMVPRYYIQNFGTAVSHPDTNEYALFLQDTVRVSAHFALSLGVRWDRQTFRTENLVSNYYYPDSGRVPSDGNNVAPRLGLAYSMGDRRPVVVRGGYGIFYTRVPSMYTSQIETDNGQRRMHLELSNADQNDQPFFPAYPNPLVACAVMATTCPAPAGVMSKMTAEVSAFARNFQTPFVQQAGLSVEKEIATRTAVNVAYLYVHGQHLIRARDANLPQPAQVNYPVYDESGTNFLGSYYTVDTFSTWQTAPSLSCPFPPCLNEVARPIPQLGSVTSFESAASSVYHGVTIAARRRMYKGFGFRVAYTFARAIDDGQDALVVGKPSLVQNAYAPQFERGPSVTDQRHRFVAAVTAEPQPFHRDKPVLRALFNDWRFAGVLTAGSGRPVNARIAGDANRDGNTYNDRLPGYRRNSFTGPDYATMDLRVTRKLYATERVRLELMVESFNLFNRANKRVDITDDGFLNSAGTFVQQDTVIGGKHYPAQFRRAGSFLVPTNAYAPRQVQVSARVRF